jgi:hypothetical protein
MACSSVVGNVADQTSRHTAYDDSNVPAAVPTAQGYRLVSEVAEPLPQVHPGLMSDLAWTVMLIGGFVVVALLLRLTGGRPGTHDDEPIPAHRRVLPPR